MRPDEQPAPIPWGVAVVSQSVLGRYLPTYMQHGSELNIDSEIYVISSICTRVCAHACIGLTLTGTSDDLGEIIIFGKK